MQAGAAGVVVDHEREGYDLGYNGAYLARCSGEPVSCCAIAGRKALARHDEGGCVGAEVEEELGNDVESEHGARVEVVVCEAQDAEEYGEDQETADLEGFPADGVDGKDSSPVARK